MLIRRLHSKRGPCRWCTLKNELRQRLGLRHPMLPNMVWHGLEAWKFTQEFAIFNRSWIAHIENSDGQKDKSP